MKDDIKDAIIPDPRSLEAKELDHLHEDLYGGLPVTWTEKPKDKWFRTSQRNQDGSNSCLHQSGAGALEAILLSIESAATYQLRKDTTQAGDFLQDIGDILYNQGTILESVTPSQNMTDPQLDSISLPKFLNIKATGYRTINSITIDAVAEAVQGYGNCILVFSSNSDEWQITPVYLGTPTTFGHAIWATDFTLLNGVKTLICNDAAGQFSSPTGVRLITEDFLNKRCRGAMYLLGAKVTPIPTSPATLPFLTDMSYGQSSPEIARLQAFLAKLGYFTYPENTGYYGEISRQAVYAFQQKYVSPLSAWSSFVVWYYKGKFCSGMTRAALNKLV